jgi:hypothetical protein
MKMIPGHQKEEVNHAPIPPQSSLGRAKKKHIRLCFGLTAECKCWVRFLLDSRNVLFSTLKAKK